MSRLDSFIRRVSAQRDVLNAVAPLVAEMAGPVLELGLGNGRTFDHLRELMPGRRIVAFDRDVRCHAASRPPEADIVLGEIGETALAFCDGGAAMVHADIGTGYADKDAATLTWLPAIAARALRAGGIAVSGLPLDHADLAPLPLPPGVPDGRYFVYRRC